MREIVGQILEGKIDYDKGSLGFSSSRIELTVQPDEIYSGSFEVLSSGNNPGGCLYSDSLRLVLLSENFEGEKASVEYTFSAEGLALGDVVKGEISVISNMGEYFLPYVITVAHSAIETSLGSIRNLFHFANLAKTNWDEAVNLFYSEEFVELFKGNDRQYLRTYRGLSAYYGNEQNVEEFLLAINKKRPIEYILDSDSVVVEEPYEPVEEYIDITRNGWGYTFLNVETDSDFVILSSVVLTDDDFLGNLLRYSFVINPEALHTGNNFAVIRFFNSFVSMEVRVRVSRDTILRQDISKDIEYRHALVDMMTYYKAFRLKRISVDTWIAQTSLIVDRMLSLRSNDRVARLFKAQLLITEERYNEARWIVDQVEDELYEEDAMTPLRAYFLYITTLLNREESYIDLMTEEVEMIYNADSSSWQVAWLLLYLSEEYAISPSKKWLSIDKQLTIGCTSPVMYVEAANMLLLNPALLTKLESVEVRVLRFMMKEEILSKDIARQVVYLAGTGKWYSESIITLLMYCYDILQDVDTLTSLCSLLIAHDRREPKFFQWYKLALEAEARVTRIYEYYMMSLNLDIPMRLPKMVYLYFSYESSLDWEHTAYLYARVIEGRRNDEDTFNSYREQIERFTISQISEGHINRDLAVVYKFVLNESIISREMADKLVKLIFTHRICIDSEQVSKILVYQSHETIAEVYPIENKEVFVPIYNKDFTIVFEDGFSNRYMKSINYDTEKLMVPGKMANIMLPFVQDNLAFDVYACECSSELVEINDENRIRYQRILDAVEIEPSYKTDIRTKLMQYYFDNDQIRELDSLLENLCPGEMTAKERNIGVRYMVIRGMYDRAFEWVLQYGTEGTEPKDLVKLCSRLISRADFVPCKEITDIAAECFFKGKYDDVILTYLCENYHGMTKNMRKLFRAAENFDIDMRAMCENMLIQMLYTGYYVAERMDIYRMYTENGGDGDVRKAFLTQCSFEYLVKEQLMEGFVFEEITKLLRRGEEFLLVCKLAYIKYYSENKDCADGLTREYIREFLEYMVSKNIFFSYFKEFMEDGSIEMNRFIDKTFIEYKSAPGKRVMIHYIVERDDLSSGEYQTREMQDMYGGVYVKSFILFFGENLLYYITEEENGDEQLTQSGSISKSDISRDITTSRFNEINDIVISNSLQDYDTFEQLIHEYRRKDFMISKLFKLQ